MRGDGDHTERMSGTPTERKWAEIRFHPTHAAEIPAWIRERSRRLAALLADDHTRFAASAAAVLRRLDLSGSRLTVMTCDDRFSVLFANWAASCDRHGIEVRATTLVFPTDERARDRVESLGFVTHFDDQSLFLREIQPSWKYGDRSWPGYMHHQNWVIAEVLGCGVDVLFQDVDLVWRHDPVPELQAQAARGADIQVMYDGPNSRFQPLYANSGFMYFRNTPKVRLFWAEVCANHEWVSYYRSQQEPLNVLLAAHAHRGLDVRVLDEDRFTNGHRYCGGRTPPDDPWVIHVSWTEDLAMKLERYEANNLWYLDEPVPREPVASPAAITPAAPPRHDDPAAGEHGLAAGQHLDGGELLRRLVQIGRERDQLADRITAMQRSASWRVTVPSRRSHRP